MGRWRPAWRAGKPLPSQQGRGQHISHRDHTEADQHGERAHGKWRLSRQLHPAPKQGVITQRVDVRGSPLDQGERSGSHREGTFLGKEHGKSFVIPQRPGGGSPADAGGGRLPGWIGVSGRPLIGSTSPPIHPTPTWGGGSPTSASTTILSGR